MIAGLNPCAGKVFHHKISINLLLPLLSTWLWEMYCMTLPIQMWEMWPESPINKRSTKVMAKLKKQQVRNESFHRHQNSSSHQVAIFKTIPFQSLKRIYCSALSSRDSLQEIANLKDSIAIRYLKITNCKDRVLDLVLKRKIHPGFTLC